MSTSSLIGKIEKEFQDRFGYKPLLARAPGRINLIGEHTDYNHGFVLPASIEKSIYVAVGNNGLDRIRALAFDYSDFQEIPLQTRSQGDDWTNYVYGVVKEMAEKGGDVNGLDVVFGGDIPAGAGLSSSAALTCSLAIGLNHLLNLGLSQWEIAFLGQKVEHQYVGVQCGIMDQFASIFGRKDHVMRLDCANLDFDYFELSLNNEGIVLCDSGVKHSLASSEYNVRRGECNQGVSILAGFNSNLESLRQVSLEILNDHQGDLSEKVYSRCKYVVEENARVQEACLALANGDTAILGRLMFETHEGLKNDYQVSCPELDLLVETASEIDGVIGSRMMGGGFGGCSINIVAMDRMEAFKMQIAKKFQERFNLDLKIYDVSLGDGASVIG